MVGPVGFEPTISHTPSANPTKLDHGPEHLTTINPPPKTLTPPTQTPKAPSGMTPPPAAAYTPTTHPPDYPDRATA